MSPEKFEEYLKSVHFLSIRINKQASARKEILQLIEAHRYESKGQPAWEEFFLGEQHYYNGHDEKALKHYLQANAVPDHAFFCYRASASLFQSLGNIDKALGFAKKALKIFPNDYLTLSLLEKLLEKDHQMEDALEVKGRLKVLEKEAESDRELYEGPSARKDGLLENKKSASWPTFSKSIRATMNCSPKNLRRSKAEQASARESISNHPVTSMETTMNTESDIFSSPKSQDPANTQALTERLYTRHPEQQEKDPFSGKPLGQGHAALEELKRLANGLTSQDKELSNRFLTGVSKPVAESEHTLEQRIRTFQLSQTEMTGNYLQQAKVRLKSRTTAFIT